MSDYQTSLLFAGDLVKYVFEHQKVDTWKSMKSLFQNYNRDPLTCVTSVGKSVLNLMMLRVDIIYGCYNELSELNICHESEICQLLIKSVPLYFPDGYSHAGFIAFCGMAIGVSVYYLHLDGKIYISYLIGLLANVLTSFILTREFRSKQGWNGLENTSTVFNAAAIEMLKGWSEDQFKARAMFVLQKEIGFEEYGSDDDTNSGSQMS